ncbi:hypothetical protein Q31b_27520 [Novipirellula aureliae]|uniref:Uncharacterized protein n=2 Tax=Novipirellula aureliae TaxID=2527966 RepID=A0A5C6DVB3_9BACT|nr:hypothetical protein Q31b_27520 [Novipirellula aureliae]
MASANDAETFLQLSPRLSIDSPSGKRLRSGINSWTEPIGGRFQPRELSVIAAKPLKAKLIDNRLSTAVAVADDIK